MTLHLKCCFLLHPQHLFIICILSVTSLKGNWTESIRWPNKIENVLIFKSTCFIWLFYQHFYKKSTLLLLIWAPHGAAMMVFSLPTKSRKRLVHDVFDHFATHFRLVHITDTDCWTQNGSTCDHIFTTFNSQILLKINKYIYILKKKNSTRNSEKLMCLFLFFIPIGRAHMLLCYSFPLTLNCFILCFSSALTLNCFSDVSRAHHLSTGTPSLRTFQ